MPVVADFAGCSLQLVILCLPNFVGLSWRAGWSQFFPLWDFNANNAVAGVVFFG